MKNIKKNIYLSEPTKLPFKNNYFDFVLAIGVVYGLSLTNAIKCLKEIIRVRNKSDIEGYLEAKSNNIKVSKYYKNEKVKPKKKDYKKGFFIRYFLQLASDDKAPVIEVIKSKHTNADAIYSKAQMRWSLSKDIEEQERLNIKNTLEVEKTFPQIRMKIYNFVEFGKES